MKWNNTFLLATHSPKMLHNKYPQNHSGLQQESFTSHPSICGLPGLSSTWLHGTNWVKSAPGVSWGRQSLCSIFFLWWWQESQCKPICTSTFVALQAFLSCWLEQDIRQRPNSNEKYIPTIIKPWQRDRCQLLLQGIELKPIILSHHPFIYVHYDMHREQLEMMCTK